MARPGRLATRALVIVVLGVFAVLNTVNALRKGGDFTVYLESGQRVLEGRVMYEGSVPGGGVIGPPFQALFFVPFAAVARWDEAAARLCWYLFNLLLLAAAVRWWTRALAPAVAIKRADGWLAVPATAVAAPLLAVAFPMQTNFEHQNLNVVLLAAAGAAAAACGSARDVRAGAAVGLAAALKAFPGLLLLPLILRRRWAGAVTVAVCSAGLTLLTAVAYGWSRVPELVARWMALGAGGGWPIRGNNQSLFAMLARYGGPEGLGATGHLDAGGHPVIHTLWLAAALLLIAWFSWRVVRSGVPRLPPRFDLPLLLATALGLAVVLSPIAWDHYWLLLFPAFFVAYHAPPGSPRWVRPAFWIAALATSGLTRLTVGAWGLAVARGVSTWTWAALLLIAATMAARDAAARRAPLQERGGG